MFRIVLLMLAVLSAGRLIGQDFDAALEDPERPWLRAEDADSAEGESAEGEEEHIETDRDSFTPATTVAGTGRVIFESAYSFLDNRDSAETHSLPEIITRFGISDRVELRLGWNWEAGGGGSISTGDSGEDIEALGSEQESQILYGVKFLVTDQEAWLPQSACIIQGTTPTSGPGTTTDLQLGYVFGWTILDDWTLDAGLRYVATQEEGDHHNLWAPSVVLKVPIHERWNVHAEYFGIFSDGRADGRNAQYFSPGVHYLISPDCEVGIRSGWGLNRDAAEFFTNVGIGLRF